MIELNTKSKSLFVGYLGVTNYEKIQQKLILPTIEKFFVERKITEFKSIEESAAFTDLDFKRENFDNFFSHFYESIVDQIYKKGDSVEIPVTYCITLDEHNCSKKCLKTQIRYDEILLFDNPIFYFIFIDVKDIFLCLRL